LRRQINRNEWTESGLHIRQKENEPVETAQALARGSRCRLRRPWFSNRRCNAIVNDGPLKAVTVAPVDRLSGWTSEQDVSPPSLVIELQGLQGAGSAKHHNGRILLVFGRGGNLILGQFERDAVTFVGDSSEMQSIPIDRDPSAADAEEAAEIDDCRAHHTNTIDDHIDNVPHILVRRAADIAAEHAVRVPCADNGD
jgi:hypothetical protein